MATGLGKTHVASTIIQRIFPERSMVLAHRQELIYQARDKIKGVTGMEVGIEMGEYKTIESDELFGAMPPRH